MRERVLGLVLAPWFLFCLAAVNVVVFTLSVTIPDDPHPFIDEWSPVSLLSGFQLLVCAIIALEIHKSRPAWLWKLIGIGFFFLLADEMLQLHESSDQFIHWLFGIQQTALTNHLDDLFVGLYGLAGLVALFAGRAEIVFFRQHWWLFAIGFVCLAIHVALDFSVKDAAILSDYLGVTLTRTWLEVVEEGFKLAAGFCFVSALRRCLDGLRLPAAVSQSAAAAVPV